VPANSSRVIGALGVVAALQGLAHTQHLLCDTAAADITISSNDTHLENKKDVKVQKKSTHMLRHCRHAWQIRRRQLQHS
jgi:azurin